MTSEQQTAPVLEVRGLSVELREGKKQRTIVKDVSFSVSPGECLGILGESGSGKSMTVKSVLGLLDRQFHAVGEAWFGERELLSEGAEKLRSIRGKEITMVLQNPMTCFDPLFRIGAQMEETFRAHTSLSRGEIRQKSIELLDQMQIQNPEEVLEKYPHQLSGGMLQRIMIGLAVSGSPRLLIADEPTTALDAITRYEVLKIFQAIRKEHKTAMIFISHDLEAVAKVADRILVMNQGRVVDRGDFDHIINHAEDAYTRLLAKTRKTVMERYQNALNGWRSE